MTVESESTKPVPLPTMLAKAGSLYRDRAYVGLVFTQFFGAFNDNVFKQMVLLLCLDYQKLWQLQEDRYQPIATILFTVSFLAFSGLAGYLSDRLRKRKIIVTSKCAEIVVMCIGLAVLFVSPPQSAQLLWLLMAVLFFMGLQSAFFGPSKYGVLPEILHEEDLPAANGYIQMTTFLAIIFGIAVAGLLKDAVQDQLWIISVFCIAIAIIGTGTSLFMRNPAPAQADLAFSPSCLLVEKSAWRLLLGDRVLMAVMIVYTVFWFAGAVVLPTVNNVGKIQLQWSDTLTSLVNASLAIGIGIGCMISGIISRRRISFFLVRLGAFGTGAAFVAAAVSPVLPLGAAAIPWMLAISLLLAGLFGGIMAVPLQVFLQARPPARLKGRIIGAMNLFTWIGVALSTGFYFICNSVLSRMGLPPCWILAILSIAMFAITFGFRSHADEQPHRVDHAV